MKEPNKIVFYPPIEEKVNIISHGIGFVLSLIAFVLLLIKYSLGNEGGVVLFSYIVYGLSLIILYLASTVYHSSKNEETRFLLNIFDHASIYILIAGTYTPFSLISLSGTLGWIIFITIWSLALIGVIMKVFFIGRFKIISTVMYVLMGWLIVFAIKPMINNLSYEGLMWLLIGGVSYTVGAVFYSIKKIKFNHAIFHIFVLVGSISHFVSIYMYV